MRSNDSEKRLRAKYRADPERTRRELEDLLIAKAMQDEAFRRELLSDPRTVIERELSYRFRSGLKIRVAEETADTVYLVLPYTTKAPTELGDFQILEGYAQFVGQTSFSFCGPDVPVVPTNGIYALVWEHADFAGDYQTFVGGTYRADQGQFSGVGNDTISSVQVGLHARVRMCEHEGADGRGAGMCVNYGPGQDINYVGDQFSDKCSFIEVIAV